MRHGLWMGVAWAGMTIAAVAQGAFTAKETRDDCANAHAVLVASASGKHDFIWGEIGKTVRSRPQAFQVVEDYEPGVVQRVSFRQYDLKYVEGGTAYVAHCGHGGTCNTLAKAFVEAHPDWYAAEVFCGQVPEALINPQRPSL
jgi:hypothetical protein